MDTELINSLPKKGVLFLGDHQNMTKKLRQFFPQWTFVDDNRLKRYGTSNQNVVFYWTGHGSHKLMQYVYSKLSPDTSIGMRMCFRLHRWR